MISFDCKIHDRTRLILEIFEKSAHTAEGKIQVAIAMLQFDKARLAGHGIFLSQQAGVIGTAVRVKHSKNVKHGTLKMRF